MLISSVQAKLQFDFPLTVIAKLQHYANVKPNTHTPTNGTICKFIAMQLFVADDGLVTPCAVRLPNPFSQ